MAEHIVFAPLPRCPETYPGPPGSLCGHCAYLSADCELPLAFLCGLDGTSRQATQESCSRYVPATLAGAGATQP